MPLNISYLYKTVIALVATLFLFAEIAVSQPLNAKLFTNTLDAKIGDTIYLQLKINPRADRPVYTVSASLMYDPNMLEYAGSNFADSVKLLPVPKPPYLLIDVVNGMIRRTAGFPNGADSLSDFTDYKFKAIKAGDAIISIEDGVALDINSDDIGFQQKELIIHITGPDEEDEQATSTEIAFTMNLDIVGPTAVYREDDYRLDIYQPGSGIDQDEKLKMYVYNEKAELYYLKEINLNALQDNFTHFTIPAYTLDVGDYTISVERVDGQGNKEIVAQKSIGVLRNNETWFSRNKDWVLPVFIFVAIIATVHHLAKDRGLYNKIPVLKRRKRKSSRA